MVSSILIFKGHSHFRQRLLLSTLSGKSIKIQDIRSEDEDHPGLMDYEANFLRLLEKVSNGCHIEINYTGTQVVYRPGVLIGGKLHHDCPVSRAIGYFLEPMIALAPFMKNSLQLTLTGITNDNVDVSVDTIRTVLLPQLKKFGIEETPQLKITHRGAPPLGGGLVVFTCPNVRTLKPVQCTDQGQIKRIRGIAYCTRVSPQMANRVMESARNCLTRYIPDVYIYTDVYKGSESGQSPGYALTLVAESTTECLTSSECAYQPRRASLDANAVHELTPIHEKTGQAMNASTKSNEMDAMDSSSCLINDYHFPTPEDLGIRTARLLLSEIKQGGCVDTISQWLYILFILLGPEDVSKVRFGSLSPFTIQLLRDIKTVFSVSFKIEPDIQTRTVLITGVGIGYVNVNKKVT